MKVAAYMLLPNNVPESAFPYLCLYPTLGHKALQALYLSSPG